MTGLLSTVHFLSTLISFNHFSHVWLVFSLFTPTPTPVSPSRDTLDSQILNCSTSASHSVDSEPRQLIIHNPRGLVAAEIGLMSMGDSKSGFVVNAPPSKTMGEVPRKTWTQLAAEWATAEKETTPGGGGDNWQATVEVWQDRTYYKIYEKVNRQVEQEYQKSKEDDLLWMTKPDKWKNFIQGVQASREATDISPEYKQTLTSLPTTQQSFASLPPTQLTSPNNTK